MYTHKDQCIQYLHKHIPSAQFKYNGDLGILRMKDIFEHLGDPQIYRVVHIAGTSGKGSTAYRLANILQTMGLSVAMTVSPHILDIRERRQINGAYISDEDLIYICNLLFPVIDQLEAQNIYGPYSYYEISMLIALYYAQYKKVDRAIIETGLGGLRDASNIITDKIGIITQIGYDHTHILGSHISQIAIQKAMISHSGNHIWVVDQEYDQQTPVTDTIDYIIHKQGAIPHHIPKPEYSYENHQIALKRHNNTIYLHTDALYQAQNCNTALTVAKYISEQYNIPRDISDIKTKLQQVYIPGRMDIYIQDDNYIAIDGAHNSQKIYALSISLKNLSSTWDIIYCAKNDKYTKDMLYNLKSICKTLYIIQASEVTQDSIIQFHENKKSHDIAISLGYDDIIILSSMDEVYSTIQHPHTNTALIGSLYFASIVLEHRTKRIS